MSSQSTRLGFSQQYLREEYLSAINDLTTCFDDCAASYHMLRRLAALTGSNATFLCVTTRKNSITSEETIVTARTGKFFPDTESFSETQTIVASYGWSDTRHQFRCTLKNDETLPERILIGYPLFNQLGNRVGVLMLVVFSEESIQILEELCPILIHLLLHRIQEFTLIDDLTERGNQEARDILAVRGIHFPLVSDFIYKTMHDINGQMAIASLQTRILKDQGTSGEAQDRALDRIEQSLVHAGDKISAQDDIIAMILGPESSCSFIETFDFALTTFGQGLKTKVDFDATHQIPRTAVLPLRGNVTHWILHNFLRGAGSVYQWTPNTLRGPIPIESTERFHPDRESPGFTMRLPSHPLLLEYLAEITHRQPSSLTGQRLPGMLTLLRQILDLCGGGFSFSEDQKIVDIVVLLPIP
jgi:hypothetical protein